MPTEIEELKAEMKLLKGEFLELHKALLVYSYQLKAMQQVFIKNDTDREQVEKLVNNMLGEYSKQLRASVARVEGNDVLYRLFKNSDNNLEDLS